MSFLEHAILLETVLTRNLPVPTKRYREKKLLKRKTQGLGVILPLLKYVTLDNCLFSLSLGFLN